MAIADHSCGTNHEPSENETLSADHSLTIERKRSGRYLDVGERMERQKRETHERVMRDWREDLDRFPGEGRCYFIGGEDGPIKIGSSRSPMRRLREIRRDFIEPMKLLATTNGGQERERYYHTLFAAHRVEGEWFERVPEIEAEIARLNEPAEPLGKKETSK
jgi:hypothetical protein